MKNLCLCLLSPSEPFQILVIRISGNGILDCKELQEVSLPEGVDHQKGLILFGKGPIWLYAHLTHLAHPSRWLAVYDPRCGGIVVQAHHPDSPPLGAILPRESIEPYVAGQNGNTAAKTSEPESPRRRAVAVVGPPHSGKSVFLFWLREALRKQMTAEAYQNRLFTLRACPDGEGDWFFEAPGAGEILRYKNRWDADFVALIVEQIRDLSRAKELLLVDCGGKIDRFNQEILNVCTDALIVSRDREAAVEWRGVAWACGLRIIGDVESVLEPEISILSQNPLRIRVGGLDRRSSPSDLPKELLSQFVPCTESLEVSERP